MYKCPCEWSQQKIETQLAIFVITFLSCCYGNCPENKISLKSTSLYPCENIEVDWSCKVSKLTLHFWNSKSTCMPSLLVLFWVIGAQRHFKSGFSVFCPPTPPPISGAPLAGLGYQEAQANPVQWLRLKLWVWEWWWGQPSACYMRVGYTTHPTGWLLYVYDILPIPYYSWKPLIQTSEPSNCSHSNSFLLIWGFPVIRTPICHNMFECMYVNSYCIMLSVDFFTKSCW